MAPEQIMEAGGVDRRVDIYALGLVVYYEVLTASLPFSSNPAQVMFAQLKQPPANPRTIVPDLPSHVCKAVLKVLAKNPVTGLRPPGNLWGQWGKLTLIRIDER